MTLYVLILLLILIILYNIINIEKFTLKFIVTLDPYKLSINNCPIDVKNKLKSKCIEFDKNKNGLYAVDIFSYNDNGNNILTILNNRKTLLLLKPKKLPDANIIDLYNNNRNIGYIDINDVNLIKKIINFKQFKKINNITTINNALFTNNNIDILLLYIDLNNLNFINFDKSFKIDFIDYENLYDKDKLKLILPHYISNNVDLNIYFKTFNNKHTPIRHVIQFDIILYGPKNLNQKCFDIILDKINNFELINYYSIYYNFYDISIDFINNKNKFILTRSNNNILEQYVDYFDKDTNLLVIYYNIKPLKINDIFTIDNNEIKDKNGKYKVIKIYPDNYYVMKRISEYIDDTFGYGYECINKPAIKTKGLCLSKYTENNILKKNTDIWDRRCVYNKDCPFYQKNKNYKNYRGGCLDGYCEMPIGIKRIGYTQYDSNTLPMCHNCINNDFYCCEDQKNRVLYKKLKSPDYAFNLDLFERKKTFNIR